MDEEAKQVGYAIFIGIFLGFLLGYGIGLP